MAPYVPVQRVPKDCLWCSTGFLGRSAQKYCSAKCRDAFKWANSAKRVPCSICGGVTGWKVGQTDSEPTCNSCRRDPSVHAHGTATNYMRGCRCDACRAAKTSAHQEYAERRRAEGRPLKRYGSSGPWMNPKVRDEVFERDNWTCQLCGEALERDSDPNSDWYPSIDHVVPYSKGGGHTASNLRAAHRWCNAIRGAEDHHADLFEVVR